MKLLCLIAGIALGLSVAPCEAPPPLPLVKADYSVCVRVNPGPAIKRRKPVLYPNNSELS